MSVCDPNRSDVAGMVAFLQELKTERRHFVWRVNRQGQIRGQHLDSIKIDEFSPLTAVCFMGMGKRYALKDSQAAAGDCGLQRIAPQLIAACDFRSDDPLRRAILETLNLGDET